LNLGFVKIYFEVSRNNTTFAFVIIKEKDMEKETFTIKYGNHYESYHNGHTMEVVCSRDEVVSIARAIYLGYVKRSWGWCEVTTPTNERICIADCM
jgi:hypothetical protein